MNSAHTGDAFLHSPSSPCAELDRFQDLLNHCILHRLPLIRQIFRANAAADFHFFQITLGISTAEQAMKTDLDRYNELAFYTLAHPDPAFIQQNVVDAYAAQHADESSKPIYIVFALIGLYLCVEKSFTGKQAQKAHMQLAKTRRQCTRPALPSDRGAITIRDVLATLPGPARDAMIHNWCVSAWEAWNESREQIIELAKNEVGVN
jgi:hypothetical protein